MDNTFSNICLLIVIFMMPLTGFAQKKLKTDSLSAAADSSFSEEVVRNPSTFDTKAFLPGEKLKFKIRYGFIKAGEATMWVKDTVEKFGEPLIHIQTKAKSISAFDWIFKVRDEVNAFVRVNDFAPVLFEKKLREGNYFVDLVERYFIDSGKVEAKFIRYTDEKLKKIKSRKKYEVKISPDVHDILSSFYYIRTKALKVGESVFITSLEKNKMYHLEIKVYRTEIVDTEAGKFRCFVVEPMLKGEGIFKQKGRLEVWLTDDHLKVPVQMKSKVAVGKITTELVKYSGIQGDIPAKVGR
jgi:hypothetical protein